MTDSKSVSCELVTSGTEILLGDIVDTNAAWIAQQLREIGVNLYYKTTVGDNEPRLRGVLEMALARSDVVLVTGGLGPTADDITRDAIANASGCPLQRHPDIEEKLRERFARWGYQRMSDNNLRQAQIPEAATVLENPVGTAPGFITFDRRHGIGAKVIAMPGVPREMKRMMNDLVLPFLQELTGGIGVIRRRILRTVGIGESSLDAELGHLMDSDNPTMGLAAHLGQADVRIAARAASADEAEALLDQMEERVRAVIGSYIYSTTPEETVESVLAHLLHEADASVAMLETVSGGAIAERMKSGFTPDTSVRILEADLDRPPFRQLLDRPPASDIARDLALHLRKECNVSHGLAVITSGRPDETFHSNQGGETWIGCAGPDRTEVARFPFGGADRLTNAWVGNRAMDILRRLLLDLEV
ncbi:MAG: CinA family nicotinamide mononucleotide deamidase-related protein [Caldilineaceae bacterium SB0675_bin_29]|uniref:CinA-like protein n=1 Tax=Caldilineaceae bacterium SB0675_bin_29 TaxID=2605266 RepID=A0A6B1G1U9_9CHLR|nr:CinA family nicotinamide mononucleotide deamidase-related protein [Caldilineaceae bacterium SB0675_bin_29]